MSALKTLRPYQKHAIKTIVSALNSQKNVVLSMPTGSGKTIVALSAALEHAKGARVSVFTRTLAEYLPWERECRALRVDFSGHVGRDRVCKFAPTTDEKIRIDSFKPQQKCKECEHNLFKVEDDWGALLKGRLKEEFQEMQRLGVESWVLKWKAKQKGCGYPFARDAPTTVKLYTHLTYFLLWKYVGLDTQIFIFDEAHNLASVTRKLSFKLSTSTLTNIITQYEELRRFGEFGSTQKLRKRLEEIERVLDFLTKLLEVASWKKDELPQPPFEFFEGDERVQRLISHTRLVLDKPDVWKAHKKLVCPKCRHENSERSSRCENCGEKLEKENEQIRAVKFIPVDPSYLVRSLNADRWILLSGSMPSSWYLSNVLGLSNFEVVELNPFEKNVKYFLDTKLDMSYEKRESVRDEAIRRALSLVANHGVTLLVTQNYEEVEWFKGASNVCESQRTTIAQVLEVVNQRCEKGEPTLITAVARGKLIEGVEFKHKGKSVVSRVLLLGVPYPNVKDEEFKEMAQYLKQKRGISTWELMLEDAVIATKQAIGRAIRGPEDSAQVFFLDKRFKRLFGRLGINRYEVLTL